MTYVWQKKQPYDGDPYADWLEEIGGISDTVAWRLRVIHLGLRDGIDWAAIQEGFVAWLRAFLDDESLGFRVSSHDLAAFLKSFTQAPFDTHDLIVFERVTAPHDKDGKAEPSARGGVETADLRSAFSVPDFLDIKAGRYGVSLDGDLVSEPENRDDPFATIFDTFLSPADTHAAPAPSNDAEAAPPCVVTGIVDHAIPFLHERFRGSAKRQTRVSAVWRQGFPPAGRGDGTVMGRVTARRDIETYLGELETTPSLNEQDLYETGQTGPRKPHKRGDLPLRQSYSHGGQVLDIAAGRAADNSYADANPILAVELPPQLVARTNGFMHEPYVKSAMNWIWYRATFSSDLKPLRKSVVINYSFGDYCGRHDGQGELDADFARRMQRGLCDMITLPAGNGYLDDMHARLPQADLTSGVELDLCVQPDGRAATFVQFWLNDSYDTLPLDIEVVPPGRPVQHATLNRVNDCLDLTAPSDPKPRARLYVQNDLPVYGLPAGMTPKGRSRVTLAIRQTATDAHDACTAPAGVWKLRIKAKEGLPEGEVIDLWVERGDTIPGFPPMGRQAYLEHDHHRIFERTGRRDEGFDTHGLIERQGTISANSNARTPIVAAAYRGCRHPLRPAHYTAAGRESGGFGMPTLSCVVEDSDARRSLLSGGTVSSSVRFIDGASAACALAARVFVETLIDLNNGTSIGDHDAGDKALQEMLAPHNVDPISPDAAQGIGPQRIGAGVVRQRFDRTGGKRFEGG